MKINSKFEIRKPKLLLTIALFIFTSFSHCLAADLLLHGATVHTVSGETLSPGDVLIQGERIGAVGPKLEAGSAQVIDLRGKHLYPGLILLNTVLGLTEIEEVRATADNTEVGEFTPDVESWVAVNPDSELIPVVRANGIAYFEPVPKGGLVSGQSGLMAVEGWTTEQRAVKKPLALHVFWPEMALELKSTPTRRGGETKPKTIDDQAKERRMKQQSLVDFFEEARAYAKAQEVARTNVATAPLRVPAWEAMLPYIRGELPVVIHADEVRQIRAAVAWATTNGCKTILASGRDAWRVAPELAAHKIPVIYSGIFNLPARDTESYDTLYTAPGVLHKAGVQVAFSYGLSAFAAPMSQNLPYCAAEAVAFGLPEAEALKGLTLYPARIAGLDQQLGSIDPGKEATLFVADGNIMDCRVHVQQMWLAGKEISLQNRQTRLYDKYRARPRSP